MSVAGLDSQNIVSIVDGSSTLVEWSATCLSPVAQIQGELRVLAKITLVVRLVAQGAVEVGASRAGLPVEDHRQRAFGRPRRCCRYEIAGDASSSALPVDEKVADPSNGERMTESRPVVLGEQVPGKSAAGTVGHGEQVTVVVDDSGVLIGKQLSSERSWRADGVNCSESRRTSSAPSAIAARTIISECSKPSKESSH